ncbi:MAG TPA: hypothetical protein VGZ73_18720 [Bryobacteraceae bacterium]|jgi:hypothetical protein|nr:hypothetical protein [Bryobacteraceae bacterium]
MVLIVAASVVFVCLLLLLIKLTRLFASPQQLPVTADWIDELSSDRYRPMLRLLDGGDSAFLRTQPGFTPKMAMRLRIQRCELFRRYLTNLDDDFTRICTALKIVMVQARQDRPDLASVLLRSQMTFAYGMVMAQFHLTCYRYGIGTVDVSGLVKLFDGMRLELRTLVPAELGAGA